MEETHNLRVYFAKLRQKLEDDPTLPNLIHTEPGVGYQLYCYFWRTAAGAEVDVMMDTQNTMIPLEIKLSETPRPEMAKELIGFQHDFKVKARPGYVIHPGNTLLPLGHGVTTLPLMNL